MARQASLEVQITAPIREFRQNTRTAAREISEFGATAEAATNQAQDGLTDAARAAGIYADAAGRLREANGRFVSSQRRADLGLRNFRASLNETTASAAAATSATNTNTAANARMAASATSAAASNSRLSGSFVGATASVVAFGVAAAATTASVDDFRDAGGQITGFIRSASRIVTPTRLFNAATTAFNLFTRAATAAALAATGIFTAVGVGARNLTGINNLSNSLEVNVERFQQWVFAARRFNFDAEKVGDVFTDISDKISDFIVTGGGEAADFFRQLNIDAREFIGLSPDLAFERIGREISRLTRGEQVFFLEALANDASRLIPLLEDNGARLRQLGQEAIASGNVLSQSQLAAVARFDTALRSLTDRARGFGSQVTVFLAGPFEILSERISELIDDFGGPEEAARAFARGTITAISSVIRGMAELIRTINDVRLSFNTLGGTSSTVLRNFGSVLQSLGLEEAGAEFRASGEAGVRESLQFRQQILESTESVDNAANAVERLAADMVEAVNRTTNTTTEQQQTTRQNTTALDRAAAAARSLARVNEQQLQTSLPSGPSGPGAAGPAGDFGVFDAARIFNEGAETFARGDAGFTRMAANLQRAIERGASPADLARRFDALSRRIDTFRQLPGLNFDIAGAAAVFNQLLVNAQEGLAALAGPQLLSSEQIEALLNRALEANRPPQLGSINIDVTTDTGRVAGEILGDPTFLRGISRIVESNNRNNARAVEN